MTDPRGGGREVLNGLHLAWVRAGDVPDGTGWLSAQEREVLSGLAVEKRRSDWLLGRWAVRVAVQSILGDEEAGAAAMAVLADVHGRPRIHHTATALSVSISHSSGVGLAVVGKGAVSLGCDVEVVAPRSDAFVKDYFTEAEADAVAAAPPDARPLLANLMWSAKESALKAMAEGLRLDTRSVSVDTATVQADGTFWVPLVVTGGEGRIFRGFWRVRDGLVWTVLTESAA